MIILYRNLDINNLKGFPSEIFSLPNLKYL